MLTPEQVAEIRRHWNVDGDSHTSRLLRDRAEIAQELECMREMLKHPNISDKLARNTATLLADALTERMK